MAMTRFAGAYDAGVSNVGIANLLTFLENTAPYRRALRASEYGDPATDREALIALSPTTYADRLRAPPSGDSAGAVSSKLAVAAAVVWVARGSTATAVRPS